VDFVVSRGDELYAVEVKSGEGVAAGPGMPAFRRRWPNARPVVIAERPGPGGRELPLEEFLAEPARLFHQPPLSV